MRPEKPLWNERIMSKWMMRVPVGAVVCTCTHYHGVCIKGLDLCLQGEGREDSQVEGLGATVRQRRFKKNE